ncbi:MAG TPA: tRNA lysidine(34) synthetase TilS [Chloroflexota bacterium]|nr:tRNA lysidine(34) synthetase TilS [Chloroflexota bacterium]
MDPADSPLLANVADFCRKHAVFGPSEGVVAAVSGGADSLCLLLCLHALAPRLGLQVRVAHVHHGLRGPEADEDAAFVASQAAALGLPCEIVRVDVVAYASSHRCSIETAAREVRYTVLREVMARVGAGCIATGHTEDDQAETLLLHLLRGSGLDGLAAMRPRRGDLARPLLNQSRQVTAAFCEAHGLAARHDRSNEDPTFRRNAVRSQLLPVLERFNPRAREALARCAALLAVDAEYLRAEGQAACEALVEQDEGRPEGLRVAREPLALLPRAVRTRVLRFAVEQLLGAGAALSARMIEEIDRLATGEGARGSLDIGRGFRAERRGELLHLFRPRARAPLAEVRLPVPGRILFGEWRLEAGIVPGDEARALLVRREITARMEALCDRTALGSPVIVRGRRPGDRLRPLGLSGTKKVQDSLVDQKVPRAERDHLPLVTGPLGIAWVVGVGLDARVAVTERTSEAVLIRATRAESPVNRANPPI